MHAVNQDLVSKGKAPLEFWDKKGEMKPTKDLIQSLRTSMESYNTHQRMFFLEKIFGEQGGLAAMALMSKGTGSWEFVKEKVLEVASAEDKMTERLKGYSATVTALGGTSKTTLATIFDPLLEPMSFVLKGLNEIVAKIGVINNENPALAKTTSYGLAAITTLVGGYGLYQLGMAGKYGGKVLKGLRGTSFASLGVGLAEGKAVEAATGVKPVFVTNWPAGFGPAGGVSEVAGGAAGGAAAGVGRKFALAAFATNGLVAATVAAPFVSKLIGDASRMNGWGASTIDRNSREYEVMGIGGKVKNDIKIDLQIDGNGKVFSHTNSLDTRISTMPRGGFFDGMMVSH